MLRALLVGFGFMGQTHAAVYAQIPNLKIVGVVDPSRAAKVAMRSRRMRMPLFTDLATALDTVEADFVDVCLPTDLHARAALVAVERGKHLFCEKPIALSLSEADEIVEAVKRRKVFAQVGHCIRFWPEYQALERLVVSEKAGVLKSLTLQRRAARPTYSTGGWLLDPRRSGGAALDLHIHDTDFVLHLLGRPRAVQSAVTRDQYGPSYIFTTYRYGNGPRVTAEGGWNYPPRWGFQMAFQVVFEEGAVEYDSNATPSLTATLGKGRRKALSFAAPGIASQKTHGNVSMLGGYFNQLRYFTDCIRNGVAPKIATVSQARESLRVALAELASAAKDSAVDL